MPRARVSPEVELEYEVTGPEDGPPVLLIMGVGAQLIHWPDPFVDLLAARGLRVIRFDNRDAGLSTQLEHLGVPRLRWLVVRALLGMPVTSPYRLDDMAGDAVGLLEHLGLPAAHVVGISMGGMIAQTLALGRPDRVLSLTSLMSTPGGRYVGQYGAVRALLSRQAPRTRDEAIECGVLLGRAISGPGYPVDEDLLRALAARSYDRCHAPRGFARQMAAILSAPPRTSALGRLRAPTLVVHGEADPLVPVEAGRATARAIPGARLVVVPGLGHCLPEGAFPLLVDAMADHVHAVHERAARAA
ncbi:MAG: alpha/beta fold hydrolase [Planctomycetes bacterium]|nr:alpha/beta fold hydrolase [Planctomycetota bacterium]